MLVAWQSHQLPCTRRTQPSFSVASTCTISVRWIPSFASSKDVLLLWPVCFLVNILTGQKKCSMPSCEHRLTKQTYRKILLSFDVAKTLFTVHAVRRMSRLAGRVARSLHKVDLLTAVESINQLSHIKHLLEESISSLTTRLVLNLRAAFHLCFGLKNPRKVNEELLFASI